MATQSAQELLRIRFLVGDLFGAALLQRPLQHFLPDNGWITTLPYITCILQNAGYHVFVPRLTLVIRNRLIP